MRIKRSSFDLLMCLRCGEQPNHGNALYCAECLKQCFGCNMRLDYKGWQSRARPIRCGKCRLPSFKERTRRQWRRKLNILWHDVMRANRIYERALREAEAFA